MKKIIALLLTFIMIFSTMTTAFAKEDNLESVYVTINGKQCEGVISNELTPYGEPATDKVPHIDMITNFRAGSPRVTASDVWRIKLIDPDYYGEYIADGYVTMMDGDDTFYHFSKAEMWYNGSMASTGSENWGWGKVNATSWPTTLAGTARIFYGY